MHDVNHLSYLCYQYIYIYIYIIIIIKNIIYTDIKDMKMYRSTSNIDITSNVI